MPEVEIEILRLRALLAQDATAEAGELRQALYAAAEAKDDADTLCALAAIDARAQLSAGRPLDAKATVDKHQWLAAALELDVRWIDLLVARSEILLALGDADQSRRSAEMALYGPAGRRSSGRHGR